MKRFVMLTALIGAFMCPLANAADGLVALKSPYSVSDTINRLEEQAKQRGLIIFARIDHAAGAAKVEMTLRPTALLIFGHPKGGTTFIQCAQTAAIDLPLRALAWEDEQGQVWLGYNDLAHLARRHGAEQCPATENLRKLLSGLAESVLAQ